MSVGVIVGELVIDARKLHAFAASPTGPIMRDLMRRGTNVQTGARRLVRKRTRTLEKSIVKRADVDGRGPVVYVVTDAPYAIYEHDGTRPHIIRPRNRKVLRFPTRGGAIVFAQVVHHPGTEGSEFLVKALPLARG